MVQGARADQELIRRAGVDDAAAIAGVHARAWRVAYRGLMPDSFLDAQPLAGDPARWQVRLADEARHVLVAERDGQLIGFVVCGPAEDATAGADCGQLYAIYLEPDAIGQGVGHALHEAARADLCARRFSRAVLWVLEGNARARRFYERLGWWSDGATKVDVRPDHVRHELRYVIDLSY